MASVVLGRVGSDMVVPTDLCVKSGIATDQRVVLRGSTTPAWVHVLLIFTVIGWLFASSMASSRFRVEVPFLHHRHDLYRRGFLVAWMVSLGGIIASCWAALAGMEGAEVFLFFTLAGVVFGVLNSWLTTVGFHQRRDVIVMTRVHPAAAAAIRVAYAEARAVR